MIIRFILSWLLSFFLVWPIYQLLTPVMNSDPELAWLKLAWAASSMLVAIIIFLLYEITLELVKRRKFG